MKLSGLLWVGAAGLAAIGGIAMHNADEIAEASHVIAAASDHFDEEFARAEREVAGGADAEKAYEDAVDRALERLDGIDIQDNSGTVRIVVSNDDERSARVSEAISELQEAKAKLQAKRASGQMSDAEFGVAESVLQLVEEQLEKEATAIPAPPQPPTPEPVAAN